MTAVCPHVPYDDLTGDMCPFCDVQAVRVE